MRGLLGSMDRSMAPVESLRASTRCHVLPPSAERYTPRMGLGPNAWPNAAAYTKSALPGWTTILAICPASRSPARAHVLPRPRPRLAAVRRAEQAVPRGHVAAQRLLAGPDVHDVGIRFGDGHRADRAGAELAVAQGPPRQAAVGRLPHAAARGAEVEHQGLPR